LQTNQCAVKREGEGDARKSETKMGKREVKRFEQKSKNGMVQ
jgi:hypothetical protein